jgi:hypothetical protein
VLLFSLSSLVIISTSITSIDIMLRRPGALLTVQIFFPVMIDQFFNQ